MPNARASFAGEATAGEVLLLAKAFRGETKGVLLSKEQLVRLPELQRFRAFIALELPTMVNLRVKEHESEYSEAIGIHVYANGHSRDIFAVDSPPAEAPSAEKPRIDAVRELQAALRYADAEVRIPAQLKPR